MKIRSKKLKEDSQNNRIKYYKPKILLIDLPRKLNEKLKSAGFNVTAGTFGSPYKIEISDKYQPVIPSSNLPGFTEKEIVIIDLILPQILNYPAGKKITSKGEEDWWDKCSSGFIDPRPYTMSCARESFDRILNNGGAFVIFAQLHLYQTICLAKLPFDQLKNIKNIEASNWSFLSVLSNHLIIAEEYGFEIFLQDQKLNEFLPTLSPHLFPNFKMFKWIENYEYEFDVVINYKNEKVKVERRTKAELEEID